MTAASPISPVDQPRQPTSGAFNRLALTFAINAEVGGEKKSIVSPPVGNSLCRLKYQP